MLGRIDRMMSRLAALLLCCGLWGGTQAETVVAAPQPGDVMPQPAATGPAEPNVRRTVIEDDHVRVEELRVRGEVRRIVVRTQGSQAGSTYEIVPADGARDMSAGPSSGRGAAGKSLWTVLAF
jgi:hypothetical protein